MGKSQIFDEEENTTHNSCSNSCSDDESFHDIHEAYDQLLEECVKSTKLNRKLLSKNKSLEKYLNALKIDRDCFEQLRNDNTSLCEKAKKLENEKIDLLGLVDVLKSENLKFEDTIQNLEKQVANLTQKLEDALCVKVRLDDSSKKLEKMLLNPKSGNNKEGLGFSAFNSKIQTKAIFVKAANSVSSSIEQGSQSSKASKGKDPQDSNLTKNFQKGKQVFGQKNVLKKKKKKKAQKKKSFQKKVQQVIPSEVHRHTHKHTFWCKKCGKKGHLREFCWQARWGMPMNVPVARPKPKVNRLFKIRLGS